MGLGDMFRGLYDILGVSPDATSEEIKKAGRDRQKETHPDAGGDHDSCLLYTSDAADEL